MNIKKGDILVCNRGYQAGFTNIRKGFKVKILDTKEDSYKTEFKIKLLNYKFNGSLVDNDEENFIDIGTLHTNYTIVRSNKIKKLKE